MEVETNGASWKDFYQPIVGGAFDLLKMKLNNEQAQAQANVQPQQPQATAYAPPVDMKPLVYAGLGILVLVLAVTLIRKLA